MEMEFKYMEEYIDRMIKYFEAKKKAEEIK